MLGIQSIDCNYMFLFFFFFQDAIRHARPAAGRVLSPAPPVPPTASCCPRGCALHTVPRVTMPTATGFVMVSSHPPPRPAPWDRVETFGTNKKWQCWQNVTSYYEGRTSDSCAVRSVLWKCGKQLVIRYWVTEYFLEMSREKDSLTREGPMGFPALELLLRSESSYDPSAWKHIDIVFIQYLFAQRDRNLAGFVSRSVPTVTCKAVWL